MNSQIASAPNPVERLHQVSLERTEEKPGLCGSDLRANQCRLAMTVLKRAPIVLFLCASVALAGCPHARPTQIMSWKEYARHSGEYQWPYILHVGGAPEGYLLYFGAAHTKDPGDPQIAQIEELWRESRLDVAFNEGGDPPAERTRDDAVRKHGEAGLVRFLAARDKVPVQSIDPTRAAEAAALLKRFSPEQVKLFFVLRVVAQHRRYSPAATLEEELQRVLPIFAATPGLNASPSSIPELESSYARYFPKAGSFRDAGLSWFDPVASDNFLNEISRVSNEYRDEYMVDLLTGRVKEGKRVFAVVGGTHVVMQEKAIRSLLR